MLSKRKVAALVAEFLGTAVLALVMLTVYRSQIPIPYFVAIAAGLSIIMFGLATTRDVHLNPAYTFALWTARRVKTLKMIGFIVAQFLGGMAAYAIYKHFAEGNVIPPQPTEFKSEILYAEAIGAFVFAFAAAGALYRQGSQLVRNITTGLAFTIGLVIAGGIGGNFINPPVAVATNAFAWHYVVGPFLGAVIGVNLYSLLFADRVTRTGVRSAASTTDKDEVKKRLNKDAIEVSPAKVASKPLAKIEKAEKAAKIDKKKNAKKSKK